MTVWVVSSNGRQSSDPVYHTKESCHSFPENPIPRERTELEQAGFRECRVCSGEKQSSQDQDWSYQKVLRNAND